MATSTLTRPPEDEHDSQDDGFHDRELQNIADHYNDTDDTPDGATDGLPDLRSDAGLRGSGAADLADQGERERKAAAKGEKIPTTDLRAGGNGLYNNDSENGDKSFFQKHKKGLLLGVGGALAALIPALIFLAFLISSLGIPDLAQDVIARELKTVAKANVESSLAVEAESEGVDAASGSAFSAMTARFGSLKNQAVTKFYGFGPVRTYKDLQGKWTISGATKNLNTSGAFVKNYDSTGKLISITFKDAGGGVKTINVESPGFIKGIIGKVIHPIGTAADKIALTNELNDAFKRAMLLNFSDTPWLIRGKVVQSLVAKYGGLQGLAGLAAKSFSGKNKQQAEVEVQRESYQATNDVSGVGLGGSQLEEGERDVAAAQEQCVASDTCLEQEITTNVNAQETFDRQAGTVATSYTDSAPNSIGIPPATENAVIASAEESTTQEVADDLANAGSPGVGALFKLCFAYLASKFDPSSAKAQGNEVMREFFLLMAVAGQQKKGGTQSSGLTAALGAMNWKLGDFSKSNPMRPAGSVNTTNDLPTQGTATGILSKATIFDVIFPESVASVLNPVANTVCGSLTNAKSQLLGASILFITKFVGGLGDVAEAAGGATLGAAAKASLAKAASSIAQKLTSKQGILDLAKTGGNFTKTAAKDGVQTAIATLIFQYAVLAHAGALHSGLATGQSFANDADNGANLFAQNTMQQVNYGRPLTDTEITEREADNAKSVALDNSSRSFGDRYFALSNADSLLSHILLSVSSKTDRTTPGTYVATFARLFNPLHVVSNVFNTFNRKAAAAATVSSTGNFYGNLQIGLSDQEYALMQQAPYGDVENDYTLEHDSRTAEVALKYDKCFTESVEDLIASGDIQRKRDNSGGVIDSGFLCSPQNLGPNNPQYGDLVWRYRLQHMLDNTKQTLLDLQQVPSGASS